MGLKQIESQLDLIKALAKPKYRKAILSHADKHLINAVCEIIYNVLKNNINLNQQDRTRLLKHKKFLRALCERSTVSAKEKILIQRGGKISVFFYYFSSFNLTNLTQ
jgi:hypothetical protein